MKIAVLGYSGAGKSTFSKRVSEKCGIPVLYLDSVNWLPKWKERPTEEARGIVRNFLDENERWVIDGNYSALEQERRLQEADQIFLFLLPAFVCLKSAWDRYKTYRGKSRESMTEGCDEKFDFEFFFWLLFGGRSRKQKNRYRNIEKTYPEKTIVFRTREEVNDYLNAFHRDGSINRGNGMPQTKRTTEGSKGTLSNTIERRKK